MIYELLSTALIACSLGAGNYKDEPKRVVFPNTFGEYEISVAYNASNGNVFGGVNGPGGGVDHLLPNWETPNNEFTISTTNNLMTTSFTFTASAGYADLHCSGVTHFNFGDKAEQERFSASYFQMEDDHSYSVTADMEIDEFNFEGEPEIYWYCDFHGGTSYTGYFRMTLPLMYMVDLETFGTTETSRVSYMKAGTEYSKTFNAIYVDEEVPKHYAFWIDTYMLSRQVRLNGDIINANYVTTLDGLDPAFGKQVSVRFTPTDDINLKVSAVPYDPTWSLTNDYNRGYNNGYTAGLAEGQTPVSWIKTTFDGIAGFFNIQVFPFVTLGFLCFAPLIVVAIIAIVRIIKHE